MGGDDTTVRWSLEDPTQEGENEGASLRVRLDMCTKRYRSLVETNLFGVQVIDTGGITTYANKVQSIILGYAPEEMEGREIWSLLSSDNEKKRLTDFLTAIARGEHQTTEHESEYLKKDNTPLKLTVEWAALKDEKGKAAGFFSLTTRIEKKQSDSEEIHDQELYSKIVEASDEMIILTDPRGNILFANERSAEVIGCFREEMQEMKISDILLPNYMEELNKKLSSVPPENGVDLPRADFINRSLKIIKAGIRAFAINKKGSKGEVLIFARKISEKTALGRESLLDGKFETASTFADGVANDLNDILTGILGNIDLALMETGVDHNSFGHLSNARKVCREAKELARMFNLFSRPGGVSFTTGHPGGIIREEAEKVLEGSEAWCEVSVAKDAGPIKFDKKMIRILTSQLVANAKEAMPSGGKIRIDVARSRGEKALGASTDKGDYVRISVQDQGVGIPKGDEERIFDPYFSTKKERTKRGSGFGLALAYAIIKKHNGHIRVDSRPGVRTIFNIYIPAITGANEKTFHSLGSVAGKKSILVMDDDHVMRKVAGKILKRFGFHVEYYDNCAETIRIYEKRLSMGAPFSAVILDLNIKNGPGGKTAMQHLMRIDPKVKGIVTSGYSNDPEMIDYDKHGFADAVEKPYTMSDLGDILKRVLKE